MLLLDLALWSEGLPMLPPCVVSIWTEEVREGVDSSASRQAGHCRAGDSTCLPGHPSWAGSVPTLLLDCGLYLAKGLKTPYEQRPNTPALDLW